MRYSGTDSPILSINSVISDKDGQTGLIVTSTFAFLELINKFDKIFELEIEERKISLARIIATIKQPPSWLVIDDMDVDTAKNFCNVPNTIESGEHISSDDACSYCHGSSKRL